MKKISWDIFLSETKIKMIPSSLLSSDFSRSEEHDYDCEDCEDCEESEYILDYNNKCSRNFCTNSFYSIITPVHDLSSFSESKCVEFKMRRKNHVVTLQWEPFSGIISASGINYLTVPQTICNTAPYPIYNTFYLKYKGSVRKGVIKIIPESKKGNIRFYLNEDLSANDILQGDSFKIYSSSISWIVEE